MSFDWMEYLSLADELIHNPSLSASEEARFRSAISRAYYAAFCLVRNHLRDVEGEPEPSTHGGVIGWFMNRHALKYMGTSLRSGERFDVSFVARPTNDNSTAEIGLLG